MKYVIDGKKMTGRNEAHDELFHALELPEYYGRNLDALWDCMTEMQGDVVLESSAEMLSHLEAYGFKLLQTMREAAEKNPNLTFTAQ